MRRRRGLSVIELLVGIVIIAIATGAVARAFSASLDYQNQADRARDRIDARNRFEDRMAELLSGATLTGANTFMISPVSQGAGAQSSSSAPPAPPSEPAPQSILADGSASLTFTSMSDAAPVRYLTSTEPDFSSLNQTFGPQAGVEEVAFSMVPVGNAGLKQGLFLRRQRPADTDPTQGGTETDMNPEVADIRFEFYDGTDWQTTWDSTSDQKGKLPTAIRVTYLLRGDKQPSSFIVRMMAGSPPAAPGSTQQSPGTNNGPTSGAPPSGSPTGTAGGGIP